MLIRHSLLCHTCMIWVFVTRITIVYPSCCQYWWHSVCTVHLFFILFLSFLFQYCLSIMESSSFFISGWWPAWVWPVWVCFVGWVGCCVGATSLTSSLFLFIYFFSVPCLFSFLSVFLFVHLWCFMWLLHAGKTKNKESRKLKNMN